MSGLEKWLQTKSGQLFSWAAIGVAAVCVAWAVIQMFSSSSEEAFANSRTYVCIESGKPFKVQATLDMQVPARSPYSGKNTGYPAEACLWNKDGSAKTEPTWVVVNETLGKREPTFCPDCGRLVVGHNPTPSERGKPPPTREEYSKSRRQ